MKENIYRYRLSIIVAIYNVETYLERCISSLVKQDLPFEEYEILLVNDGSTDGSLDICNRFAAENSNITVYTKENGGLSSVRNFGIDHAQGRYIMHVDADDFLEEYVIGKIVKVTEENNLELCFFDARSTKGHIQTRPPFSLYKVYTGEYILLHGMQVGAVWKNIYAHAFVKRTGLQFYGNISHQDVEYNYRLYSFVNRLMFTDICVYNYNEDNESITRTNDIKKIEKKAWDDLTVVTNVRAFSKASDISDELKEFYEKKMNSVFVSLLFSFTQKDSPFSFSFVKSFLKEAQKRDIYPVHGKTMSKKTTRLIKWMNMKILYQLAVLLRKLR